MHLRDVCYNFYYEVKAEPCRIKNYVRRRFKDLTQLIRSNPAILLAVPIVALAAYIYEFVRQTLIFAVIFDYFGNTYFLRSSPSRGAIDLSMEFYFLDNLKAYRPDYEKLKAEIAQEEDPEMRELMQELLPGTERMDKERREELEAYENSSLPLFAWLQGKSDHNGAFKPKVLSRQVAIGVHGMQKTFKERYKLFQKKEIATLEALKDTLKTLKKVECLWLAMHGTPTSMLLDGDQAITPENIEELREVLQGALTENAHVILSSCSTGKKIAFGSNMAEKFSEILPGRTIWAPSIDASRLVVDLEKDSSIKAIHFFKVKNRLEYLFEKIDNIFHWQFFKEINLQPEGTV